MVDNEKRRENVTMEGCRVGVEFLIEKANISI